MILYRKSEQRDFTDITEQLRKGSGLNKNHFPHGFSAVAAFDFGDIYIAENINAIQNDSVCRVIDSCLLQMMEDDFGRLTAEEIDANLENKYLGNGTNIVGRYETDIGVIFIRKLESYTYILLEV